MTETEVIQSFWAKVDTSGECWEWTASRTRGGYGHLRVAGGRYDYAHRVSYRIAKGEIPAGLHIDHLCRNRGCVNPEHLEAVTPAENSRRGASPYGAVRTECKNGHDITNPANVYTAPKGDHRCRVCARAHTDEARELRQARGDLRRILKTHCKQGHPFDAENTAVTAGRRVCRACSRAISARQRAKKR